MTSKVPPSSSATMRLKSSLGRHFLAGSRSLSTLRHTHHTHQHTHHTHTTHHTHNTHHTHTHTHNTHTHYTHYTPWKSSCPKNLYNLARSYFRGRTATLHTNSIQIERDVNKGCPEVSCCGPGFWNVQYNSLLNLNYGKRTKAIAFADDLLIAVRSETSKKPKTLLT